MKIGYLYSQNSKIMHYEEVTFTRYIYGLCRLYMGR